MKDFFMMKQFVIDELLYSPMARLRGKYCIIRIREARSQKPNQTKIDTWRKRGIEISIKMRTILSDLSLKEKQIANKGYRKELKQLNEFETMSI